MRAEGRCRALGAGKEPGGPGLGGEVGEVARPAPPPCFPLWAPGVAPPAAAYSGSCRASTHTTRTAAREEG